MTVVGASAPGRINLIGEHTDYNDGYALPIALTERTTVEFETDGTDRITLRSNRIEGGESFGVDVRPGDVAGWSAYPAGVVWAMAEGNHPVVGGTMTVGSDVPIGAGLSSSAALECAVLLAMTEATGAVMDRLDMARLAQRAENDFVGAPTGLMDQLASLHGRLDHALLVDFESFSVREVPFDPAGADLALMVVDSRAAHSHSTGAYAERRASCTRAAAALGVDTLRAVQDRSIDEVLARVDGEVDRRRVRHVLTENQRVLDAAKFLADSDFDRLGQSMSESHRSMRDDFEITTPHIDTIADSAVRHGALGARMTGGGFGGCVIALVPAAEFGSVEESIRRDVDAAGFPAPTVFAARAGDGARVSSPRPI